MAGAGSVEEGTKGWLLPLFEPGLFSAADGRNMSMKQAPCLISFAGSIPAASRPAHTSSPLALA